jgi:N-acetylglucosaminyldiphosphoundecaprenol N-acetyl-beta-D-mannosaminyltransferase
MSSVPEISVAGLKVNPLRKTEALAVIAERLRVGTKTWITTPYSEFLYRALRDKEVMQLINASDLALCDGVGLQWAATFLQLPSVRSYYARIAQSFFQMVYSGASILLRPSFIRQVIPEKIVGADLFWDLLSIAERDGHSVYFLGGFANTPEKLAAIVARKYPHLKVVGSSGKHGDDPSVLVDIHEAKPDLLLVAYGPITQERWIAQHLHDLPVKLVIGLGGTFDYVVGARRMPPASIRAMGLEWLYRLITQPYRWRRIYRGVIGLIGALIRVKVYTACGYRPNALACVLNSRDEILVVERNPILDRNSHRANDPSRHWQFPQGGLDEGESVAVGAQRELREETGLMSVTPLGVSELVNQYDFPLAFLPLIFSLRTKHRGQRQSIAYFRFTGNESEFQLDDHELVAHQWVPAARLLEVVHPDRVPAARIILTDLPRLLS